MKMSNYPKETDERMKAKTAIELLKDIQNDIRHYACIYPNVNDSYLNKLVAEVYLEVAIDKLKKYEKSDKYRWHDLRKDPKDLPKSEAEVSVMAKMKCAWDGKFRLFEIRMTYSGKILCTGDVKGWGVSYPYDFDFETDEVIAWREIEPFEEDEA